MCDNDDVRWMGVALKEAEAALDGGDFPVGCIVVAEGRVVATGRRSGTAEGPGNELDHAEVTALRRLMESGGSPRGSLQRCTARWSLASCVLGRFCSVACPALCGRMKMPWVGGFLRSWKCRAPVSGLGC